MKSLIVYYSLEGNTEYAARAIASILGADMLRIEPVKAYPTSGFRKFFWGGKSAVMAEQPQLQPYTFRPEIYDRIIFGFPIWAGKVTPPLHTFVQENLEALIFNRPEEEKEPVLRRRKENFLGTMNKRYSSSNTGNL